MSSNVTKLRKTFKKYPKLMTANIRKRWGDEGQALMKAVDKRLVGGTTKTKLAVRTGTLRRAFKEKFVGHDLDTIRLIIYFDSTAPYAKTHEEGKTIRPKRAKMLAIPADAAKTAAGVAKYSGPIRDNPEIPPLRFVPLGDKGLLIAKDSGELMFTLVKSVKIPPRIKLVKELKKRKKKFLHATSLAVKDTIREARYM